MMEKEYPKLATHLAKTIACQNVNRKLHPIDRGVGTLTAFAFSKGPKPSENKTTCDALIQDHNGEAIVKISGKETLIKLEKYPHYLSAMTQFKMLLTTIRSQILI